MTFLSKGFAGLALCILAGCVTTTRSVVVDGRVVDVSRETRTTGTASTTSAQPGTLVSADGRRAILMETGVNPVHVAWHGNEAYVTHRKDAIPPTDLVRQMVQKSTGCRPGAGPVSVALSPDGNMTSLYRLTCPA